MIYVSFDSAEKEKINYLRYNHPQKIVRRKMEVLWLKSKSLSHKEIAKLARVSENTLRSYLKEYLANGLDKMVNLKINKRVSELINFESIIKEEFTINPPTTLKEATLRIEKLTGIKRSTTQVKKFLIKIGIKRRKVGQIPGKADPEIQEEYKKKILEPRLEEAKKGMHSSFVC